MYTENKVLQGNVFQPSIVTPPINKTVCVTPNTKFIAQDSFCLTDEYMNKVQKNTKKVASKHADGDIRHLADKKYPVPR